MQCTCTYKIMFYTVSTGNFTCQLPKTKKFGRVLSTKDKVVEQMYPERPRRSDHTKPPGLTPWTRGCMQRFCGLMESLLVGEGKDV